MGKRSRMKFWRLPLPKKQPVKCVSGFTNGWPSLPKPMTKLCIESWSLAGPCIKTAASPMKMSASSYQIYTNRFWRRAVRCKSRPFTAGLPQCCAVRLWQPCSSSGCHLITSCWKTMAPPERWCGGGFMQRCSICLNLKLILKQSCRPTAAFRQTRRCKAF